MTAQMIEMIFLRSEELQLPESCIPMSLEGIMAFNLSKRSVKSLFVHEKRHNV